MKRLLLLTSACLLLGIASCGTTITQGTSSSEDADTSSDTEESSSLSEESSSLSDESSSSIIDSDSTSSSPIEDSSSSEDDGSLSYEEGLAYLSTIDEEEVVLWLEEIETFELFMSRDGVEYFYQLDMDEDDYYLYSEFVYGDLYQLGMVSWDEDKETYLIYLGLVGTDSVLYETYDEDEAKKEFIETKCDLLSSFGYMNLFDWMLVFPFEELPNTKCYFMDDGLRIVSAFSGYEDGEEMYDGYQEAIINEYGYVTSFDIEIDGDEGTSYERFGYADYDASFERMAFEEAMEKAAQ